jgi:hypothetical protein
MVVGSRLQERVNTRQERTRLTNMFKHKQAIDCIEKHLRVYNQLNGIHVIFNEIRIPCYLGARIASVKNDAGLPQTTDLPHSA